jgi:hypothetical protein
MSDNFLKHFLKENVGNWKSSQTLGDWLQWLLEVMSHMWMLSDW